MDSSIVLLVVLALVLVAAIVGFVSQRARRRIDGAPADDLLFGDDEPVDLFASLGTNAVFGQRATLVFFSSPGSGACDAAREMLVDLARWTPGVGLNEVDITQRGDIASTFDAVSTPTVVMLDAAGTERARFGGALRREELEVRLIALTPS